MAGPTEQTSLDVISSISAQKISCEVDMEEGAIETTAAGARSLTYDSTLGQYLYNWKTPKTPNTCYRVSVTSVDGSILSALFKLN
jgi:hypothetical protein